MLEAAPKEGLLKKLVLLLQRRVFHSIPLRRYAVVGVITNNSPIAECSSTSTSLSTILEWKPLLKPDKYKEIIIGSLRFLVQDERVKVYGFVIMPNHLHLLWKMEEPHKREDVQRDFLKYTAQQIKFDLVKHHPAVLEKFRMGAKDRQYQIWERNPLSVYCYSKEVTEQKLGYIHRNPVQEKWQLAALPEEYRYSSARFYLEGKDVFGFLTHYMELIENCLSKRLWNELLVITPTTANKHQQWRKTSLDTSYIHDKSHSKSKGAN